MNVSEAIAWSTVRSFLAGELDHGDESARTAIASACARLDQWAHAALRAGTHDDEQAWDEHLCFVSTEER